MSLDHNAPLRQADPTVARLIDLELRRQQNGLELIASENFASRAVIDAMGTPLTNKYAEGYPGRRYYGGCEVVDQVEQLAIDRLKELFGSEHANVQPHSGAQANFAAFMALIKPGETLMGMSLPHGGHLSHGAPVNHSGIVWRAVHYGVNPTTGRRSPSGSNPGSSSPAAAPMPGSSTSPPSAPSRTRSARSSWWTWPTSRGWSPAASTPRRCRTLMS